MPNVAWLPSGLAKLTDQEGGPYQKALQVLWWSIYRHVEVSPLLRDVAEEEWALIPQPQGHVAVREQDFAWFVPNPRTVNTNLARVHTVIEALLDIEAGNPLPRRVVCSRYAAGLPSVDAEPRRELLDYLRRFPPTA